MMDRGAHIQWAKVRAFRVLEAEGPEAAIFSFARDLGSHPGTTGDARVEEMGKLIREGRHTEPMVRQYIEWFC